MIMIGALSRAPRPSSRSMSERLASVGPVREDHIIPYDIVGEVVATSGAGARFPVKTVCDHGEAIRYDRGVFRLIPVRCCCGARLRLGIWNVSRKTRKPGLVLETNLQCSAPNFG